MNFSGHDGPVLCVEWGHSECFSGGLDGQIYAWPIPRVRFIPLLAWFYFFSSLKLNYTTHFRNLFWVADSLVIPTPFGHSLFKMKIFYLVHLMEP